MKEPCTVRGLPAAGGISSTLRENRLRFPITAGSGNYHHITENQTSSAAAAVQPVSQCRPHHPDKNVTSSNREDNRTGSLSASGRKSEFRIQETLEPLDDRKRFRMLSLYRKMGFFHTELDGTEISRAMMPDDLRRAYHLVYHTFLENGYIMPCESRLRIRPHDTDPATALFVAKKGEMILAVHGVVPDSPDLGLPSEHVFAGAVGRLRDRGKRICEAVNQTVLPAFRKSSIITELDRCILAQAGHLGCNTIITAVSPSHISFYRLFYFEMLDRAPTYTEGLDDPVILMALDLDALRERFGTMDAHEGSFQTFMLDYGFMRNPYFDRVGAWAHEAARRYAVCHSYFELFRQCPSLFANASPRELGAMRTRLGETVFTRLHECCTGDIPGK